MVERRRTSEVEFFAEPRPLEERGDEFARALVRMQKHAHAGRLFEMDNLRLPNGDYTPDAPEKLHKFWLQYGLYVQVGRTNVGNVLTVDHIMCVEDIS